MQFPPEAATPLVPDRYETGTSHAPVGCALHRFRLCLAAPAASIHWHGWPLQYARHGRGLRNECLL